VIRVLILVKGLGRGGAEQLLVNALPYLDTARFHYHVAYVLPGKSALVGAFRAAGIEVTCLASLGPLGRAGPPGWTAALVQLLHRERIDLVHAHSPVPAVASRLALTGRRTRLVYTEHNEWPRYRWQTRWANMATYPRNDHVFAVSDGVRSTIRYPAPLRRLPMPLVETLHHGLDHATIRVGRAAADVRRGLGIPVGVPVVGTVANFKPHKGYDLLMEAAARIRRAAPGTHFVLVGQGPVLEETRRRAADLGLDGSVVLTGFREDALELCSALDVFTLASLNEGLSVSLLEAMALGKPSAVTRVGGIPEVVRDGVEGFLVPPGDPAALADRVVALLHDDGLRARMGEAARQRARTFDIRLAVRRMEAVYEELCT
jgi:glycosyltransferase involved in cell wall biosynthesis